MCTIKRCLLNFLQRLYVSFKNAELVTSLYIHWPFCPYKCSFCPFVAFSKFDHFMEQYHKALHKEIDQFIKDSSHRNELKTIYIGGGTPSTWPSTLLIETFGILKNAFSFDNIQEITIEANPGTVQQEQLAIWKDLGITRISIGVQSLNDQVLAKMTRYQKASDVYRLMDWAKGMFHTLSIDLIIGLPEISDEEWKRQVLEIMQWPIQHISIYFLSIHEGTALYFRVKREAVLLPPDDDIVDLYYWTVETLKEHGFDQYEVSSFAKKGHESHHNRAYWTRKTYKGLGVGAWSFDGESRFQNEKKLITYMEAQEAGDSSIIYKEFLTEDNIRFERIMLGLRSLEGFFIDDALIGLSELKKAEFFEKVAMLKEKNFIRQMGDKIYLTTGALTIENEIAVALTV